MINAPIDKQKSVLKEIRKKGVTFGIHIDGSSSLTSNRTSQDLDFLSPHGTPSDLSENNNGKGTHSSGTRSPWQNEEYWSLPANVRNAIDLSNSKSTHSRFYYKLQDLNDKLKVYNKLFSQKVPNYMQPFEEKKKEIRKN